MPSASISRTIAATPERVWGLIEDLAGWQGWAPLSAGSRMVSRVAAGEVGGVAVYDVQEQIGLLALRFRAKYTALPGGDLDEEATSGDWTGRARVSVKHAGDGSTVSVQASGSPRGFWPRLAFIFMGGRALPGFWDAVLGQLDSVASSPCSIAQPMYCPSRTLDAYFGRPSLGAEALVNGEARAIDLASLTVYDNHRWKGIYPPDSPAPAWVFQNGFNKTFVMNGGQISGVTSTFDDRIRGNNRVSAVDPADPSKGVLLEYTDPQYSQFYDLLKVVGKDTVVGKAFVGKFPQGTLLLNFTMATRYSFDFMSAEDHRELFDRYGREPDVAKIAGEWEGRMVSNASLTPPLFRFWYAVDSAGKVSCRWNFMDIMKGNSRIEMTKDQMLMFDFTNFHDEIRMLTPDAMVGRYLPRSSKVLDILGDRDLGLLHLEKDPQGGRPMIYYYIKRVAHQAPPQ